MTDASHWNTRLAELAAQSEVPGAVLGIWADGEEILASSGVLSTATGVETTADSVFQVGSITKLWTVTMIMQLVEERRLSLDATISDVLPGTRIGAADVGGRVTIRHLLTHTSGLDGDLFTDTGRGDDCVRRYVDELAGAASVFAPGAAYSYCNSGFVLAGRVIEALDGRPWEESLRDRLIGPLGLTSTMTLPEEAILRRAATGHDHGEPVHIWGLPRSIGPAGTITASPHDLLTFSRLHLDGGITADGKRLLGPESVAAMQRQQAGIPLFTETDAAIGLGWRMARWHGRLVIGHDGGTIGQTAFLRIVPDARIAVCLLTNAYQGQALYQSLLPEVFASVGITMPPGPVPAPVNGASQDVAGYAGYTGRYERTARRYDVSVADGHLRATAMTTSSLATLTGPQPDEVTLLPADDTGRNFVCRSRDAEPWTPVSFGELGDGTRYLFASGRIAPRVN
ncbi:MAG TPA: serine hydrolase domain-containing protein [Streptosporangiaceae bacterium]|nr:serine hydrolase domain-containing protein [Streptosporangiaceae bacterium]